MEEEITCNMSNDEENQKIIITDLIEKSIELEYSSDIDFTNLVSVLTEKIDESKVINLNFNEDIDDEKLQLVVDTINDIFDLYNQSITEEIESDEEL